MLGGTVDLPSKIISLTHPPTPLRSQQPRGCLISRISKLFGPLMVRLPGPASSVQGDGAMMMALDAVKDGLTVLSQKIFNGAHPM